MAASAPVPPQNLDAEESVLGAMLLSAAALEAVAEEVQASDFYRESHGRIFTAAVALHVSGAPVDAITLPDFMSGRPALDPSAEHELAECGGHVRIHELAALVPATANARHYARIVRSMAQYRSVIRAGGEITRLGWERGGEAAELIEEAQAIAFGLSDDRAGRNDMIAAADALDAAFARIRELQENGRDVTGVATGYERVDANTSGLQPGNLIIVAARPSMGKSALALGLAAQAAIHDGRPVALFTLEMSQAEVMQRLLSMHARVESGRIRNGRLDAEAWDRLHHAGAAIHRAPLFIEDSGALSVMDLRAKARRLKTRHPDLALIVVDYLQLMAPDAIGGERNRVQEVSQISRALKVLARELNVPVVALSQLSRAPEQRHDKRPILSDLRESGALEQDADLVWMLYRDEYYNPEDPDTEGIAELNIAKHRNGPTEVVKLAWTKRFALFGNLVLAGDVAGYDPT